MTAEEIYSEILKSRILREQYNIPEDVLNSDTLDKESNYYILEYIKTIITSSQNQQKGDAIYNKILKIKRNGINN